MSDETIIEHETETIVDETPDDPKDILRQAREMIPVGRAGVELATFAQQVDYARDMAKAIYSIPKHLQKNIGDCLAIVDIATRAGLSPYMVARKTFVHSNIMEFESQLYHAFAQASGLLRGDLTVEYLGEGDDLTCTVTGYLKSDPLHPRVHTSERLAKAHPGHVTKDGKTFVRGSPLWDRKPKVQLFYDTSRDWVRIYCPQATLGIYARDEIEEYGPDFARDVSPVGLHDRLAGSERSSEGHTVGHADRELDHIAGKGQVIQHEAGTGPEQGAETLPVGDADPTPTTTRRTANKRTTDQPRGRGRGTKQEKASKKADPPARTTTLTHPKNLPSEREVKRVADAAEKSRAAKLSEEIDAEMKSIRTASDYLKYARRWIKACNDSTELFVRWTAEKKLRNAVGLTAEDREPLETIRNERREELEK